MTATTTEEAVRLANKQIGYGSCGGDCTDCIYAEAHTLARAVLSLADENKRLHEAVQMLRFIPLTADKVYRDELPSLFTDEDRSALYLDEAVRRVLSSLPQGPVTK